MKRLHQIDLDQEALFRLKFIDGYLKMRREGRVNVRYLCGIFGIGKSTFYKWRKRFNPSDLNTLKSRSRKPKRVRRIPWDLVVEICLWKRENPPKSHYYLWNYWIKEGRTPPCSPSTIYNWWKRRDLILVRGKRKRRKLKLFNQAQIPGELIQLDTKFLPHKRYQYTAIDVVSKWRYAEAYPSLNQENSVDFIHQVIRQARDKGIKIQRIQTDNGPEFQSRVVSYLEGLGIKHQYIWIHTPDQNGCVERSHRTDEEEFYQQKETGGLTLEKLNEELEEWIRYYNGERLHYSLNYATPEEYLSKVKVSTI